ALAVSGAFSWTGGTMSGTGSTNIGASGSLALTTGNTKVLSARTINNSGTITWASTGWIDGNTSPVINNLAGATFDATGDALFRLNGTGIPTFNNAGVLRKTAGSAASEFQVVVNNQAGGVIQ